jgi:hypothetical protein
LLQASAAALLLLLLPYPLLLLPGSAPSLGEQHQQQHQQTRAYPKR